MPIKSLLYRATEEFQSHYLILSDSQVVLASHDNLSTLFETSQRTANEYECRVHVFNRINDEMVWVIEPTILPEHERGNI